MNASTAIRSSEFRRRNRGKPMRRCACLGAGMAGLMALAALGVNAATVRLANAPGFPGQTTQVPMELQAGTNLPPHVVAIQADVIFDPSRVSSRAATAGSALRGHRVASRETVAGLRRVVLYSPSNSPMTNGTLVRLPFDLAPGNFLNVPLELTNVVLATAAGASVAATNFHGVIYLNPVFFAADGTAEGFLRGGTSGQRYLVQATSDFLRWTTIATNEAAVGVIRFADPEAASHPHRFYRAVLYEAAGQIGGVVPLPGGQLRFSFSGLAGRICTIEASTNLVDWQPVSAQMVSSGSIVLTNEMGTAPQRFFRVVSQP